MKQRLLIVVLVVAVAALCVPPVFAQATGSVKGVCKDAQGNPIMGANLEWSNTDNGRKYNLKTNKKGEYFSLGIEPGKYKVTLTQDGKQLDMVSGFPVGADEATLDFDLKKSQTEAAQQKGISPEQLKAMQEKLQSGGLPGGMPNLPKDLPPGLRQGLPNLPGLTGLTNKPTLPGLGFPGKKK